MRYALIVLPFLAMTILREPLPLVQPIRKLLPSRELTAKLVAAVVGWLGMVSVALAGVLL